MVRAGAKASFTALESNKCSSNSAQRTIAVAIKETINYQLRKRLKIGPEKNGKEPKW